MNHPDILLAAAEHLMTMSPRPAVVVLENIKYDNVQGTHFVVEEVPGDTLRLGLQGTHRFDGIFQVSVVVPLGQGVNEAKILTRRLCDHFYGVVLSGARVDHYPRVVTPYSDQGVWYRIPVQVRYRGFSQPA